MNISSELFALIHSRWGTNPLHLRGQDQTKYTSNVRPPPPLVPQEMQGQGFIVDVARRMDQELRADVRRNSGIPGSYSPGLKTVQTCLEDWL